MKIILKIVIVLVIVVCIITLLRIVEFKKYESLVDEDLYKQLVLMEENKKYYQNRLIIPSKDRPFVSNEAFWDNQLVRLRVELAVETKDDVSYDYIYDVVEIKDSPPSDWRQLLRKIDFCEYATVWKSQLFCISSGGNIRLNVVQSTSEYREIQLVGHTSIGNYDPFVDNNFLSGRNDRFFRHSFCFYRAPKVRVGRRCIPRIRSAPRRRGRLSTYDSESPNPPDKNPVRLCTVRWRDYSSLPLLP